MKLTLGFVCLLLILSLTSSARKRKQKKNSAYKTKSKSRSKTTAVAVGAGGSRVAPHNSYIHNAEFVVGLVRLYEQYHEYLCAAAIISKVWAVTSPSCAREPQQRELVLGKVVLRGGTKWIEGTGGFDHRILRTDLYIFIGLLKVKDPFINTPYEQPVPLIASTNYNYSVDLLAEYFGWEESIYRGTASQAIKRSVVQLISDEECQQSYPSLIPMPKNLVCATNVSGILCQGAGGGPLVVGNVLIGISVITRGFCNNNMAGLYIKLAQSQEAIIFGTDDKDLQFFPPFALMD